MKIFKRKNKNLNVLEKYMYNGFNKRFLNIYSLDQLSYYGWQPGLQDMQVLDKNGNIYNLDNINTYFVNSDGFRDDEFNNAEILCAGCSHTYGTGVPQEGTWPNILKKISNKTIANLGATGYATNTICNAIIKYCEKYEKPKYIFCLFPEMSRFSFIEDIDYHINTSYNSFNKNKIKYTSVTLNNVSFIDTDNDNEIYVSSPDKFIKNPFNLRNNISIHYSIHQYINSIFYLEQYCKSNNIKLIWTTWDLNTKTILNELKNIPNFELKKYIEWDEITHLTYNPNFVVKNCLLNHNNELSSHKSWDLGSDIYRNNEGWSHPGIHYQQHVAEFFNKFIKD